MNTEIIKNIYTAFKAKDLPEIIKLQADDVEWSVAGPADKIPWAATRQGHEGVKDFIQVLSRYLVPEIFTIHDYFENRDKVVALGYQKGHVGTTNVPYEFDFVHVWQLQNSKVTHFRVYYDTDYLVSVLKTV